MNFNPCTCAEFQQVTGLCPSEIPFAAVSCAPKCLLTWNSCCYRWKHTSLQFIPKTNQPNEGLVSEVPIIFVWEQNTWQSCPVLSPSVSWYAVFFLLGSMKLFDTKYGKHANLEPSFYCLYCHSIPAGKKKKKKLSRTKLWQEKIISIPIHISVILKFC